MSAVYGLIHLDGQAVCAEDLASMSAALAAYGPDGDGHWTQGAVGLGQRLMCFTPEDRFERQPLLSADGQRVLVCDGRIDNRRELIAALEFTTGETRSLPDSAFILRAYEQWGDDCARHLIGAFAFALWDGGTQSLLLARSPIGGPSLFYHSTPRTLAFATMPKGLFALPFVPRALDEEMLAGYLTMVGDDRSATFYRDIRRLWPGQVLSAQHGAVTVKAFWQPDPTRELRFARDADYVAAFNELFERVVSDQLRSLRPVGVMMSGGFDSTAVAATAARLLQRDGKQLAAFTEVPRTGFNGAIVKGRHADETPFVQSMARLYANLDLNLIRTDGRTYLEDLDTLFEAAEIPFRNATNRVWYEAILREAQRQGVGVLLNGGQGNLTISWGGDGLLPQLLRKARWSRALREALALARQGNARSPIRALVGQGIMPLLPSPLWYVIERLRRPNDPMLKSDPPWRAYSPIHPDFAAAQQIAKRARARNHDFFYRLPLDTRTARYKTIAGTNRMADGLAAGYQALFGIEVRDPTSDVRVVEFCLALPEEQYLRDGRTRWLLRRAMKDRLPPEILANKKRGLQAADWFERLRDSHTLIVEVLTQLEQSDLASRALDLPRIRQLVEQMPQAGGDAEQAMRDYRGILERALMTGRFLYWFESRA